MQKLPADFLVNGAHPNMDLRDPLRAAQPIGFAMALTQINRVIMNQVLVTLLPQVEAVAQAVAQVVAQVVGQVVGQVVEAPDNLNRFA